MTPNNETTRAGPLFAIGTALALTISSPVAAQSGIPLAPDEPCELDLTVDDSVDWRGLYGRGYEVFANEDSYEVVQVSVRHMGAECEFFLTAMPLSGDGTNALTGPGDPLYYDLLKSTSGPSFLSEEYFGTATSRVDGRFGDGSGVQAATLYVAIPASQFVRGGTYSGQVLVRLFRVGADGPELAAEAPMAILAPVASVLKVESDQFASGERRSTIDLGDLSREVRRSVDFNILSNADVDVRFESANQGRLAHNAGAPGIAYQVMFKGINVDLSSASSSDIIEYNPTSTSQSLPIEIVVPQPIGLPAAGQYDDVLTVTFTAQ